MQKRWRYCKRWQVTKVWDQDLPETCPAKRHPASFQTTIDGDPMNQIDLLRERFADLALWVIFWAAFATPLPAPTNRESQHKLERGGRVSVSNHHGSISILGWDEETVQA